MCLDPRKDNPVEKANGNSPTNLMSTREGTGTGHEDEMVILLALMSDRLRVAKLMKAVLVLEANNFLRYHPGKPASASQQKHSCCPMIWKVKCF